MKTILEIKNDLASQGKYTQPAKILDLSRAVSASDPRDHVYGLAGLFQPKISKTIAPNYKAAISDVFRNFTLSVIDVTGDLDIIC